MTPQVAYLERAAEARRNIPKVIRLLLAVSGRPARDLADALGLSEASLSERLHGKTRITGEQVAVCALFFDVDESLFYRDPESFRRQIMGSPGTSRQAAAATGEPTDRWINWAGRRASLERQKRPVQPTAEAKVA